MRIRGMLAADWPGVAAIYREGIATGDATFETVVPSWVEFDATRHPVLRLVAEQDGAAEGTMLGWSAAMPVSSRRVYSGVLEHSVYVAERGRGRGVGRVLLSSLAELATRCGVWTLRAGVFPENVTSLALHAQCGFREVGRQRRLGFGGGRWRDVVLTERRALGVDGERPFLRLAPTAGEDAQRVTELLIAAGLPPDGLAGCRLLLVADATVTGGDLVGAAALERHAVAGEPAAYLLRSVVVDPAVRQTGLGRRLVTRVVDIADTIEGGRARIGLLTMSDGAAGFFHALGFEKVDRSGLPSALAGSPQLQGVCPDPAIAWHRR